jgi:hypothetical protein
MQKLGSDSPSTLYSNKRNALEGELDITFQGSAGFGVAKGQLYESLSQCIAAYPEFYGVSR